MATTLDELMSCALEIEVRLSVLFSELEDNRDRIVSLWRETAARRGGSPQTGDLLPMGEYLQPQLETHEVLDGIGFIVRPHALADTYRHIEWWRRSPNDGSIDRFPIDVSADAYSYERRPYFLLPGQGHQRAIDGPYLDYLATQAYILTFGVPVTVDDEFIGVSGCDVLFEDMEQLLLPVLRQVGRVAVVNRDGRVVLSTSPTATTGERLRTSGDAQDEVPVGGEVGWVLRRLPG